MKEIKQELANAEESRAHWNNELAQAQKALCEAQKRIHRATQQIDLHNGRIGGLKWALENLSKETVGNE